MKRRIIFRSSAQCDLADAYRWYEEQQPGLGANFIDELDKVEHLISDNPELFAKVRGEVRRAILNKFPYGVFYVVHPDFISVIAVLHHARNPEAWRHATGRQ